MPWLFVLCRVGSNATTYLRSSWYRRAAERGYSKASDLASMYCKGEGSYAECRGSRHCEHTKAATQNESADTQQA